MSGLKTGWKRSLDNDWNTPKKVWNEIKPFIPTDKTIWLPFYNDGYAGKCLAEMGFTDYIHKDEDFFDTIYNDVVVVDNPPYKLPQFIKSKEKIMLRLLENKIPFMLLYPSTTIQTQYFKKLIDKYGDFQLIVPDEKYNFEKYEGDKSRCLFYTLWICWKMNLPKDYICI